MERLAEYDVFSIPVTDIFYDAEFNCRREFTLGSIETLAGSISKNGLQFPVVVQPWVGDHPFRLLAGHRRYVAAVRFLKWENIPASVRPNLTELQARILNYTENLERKDLNILEEALALGHTFNQGQSLRDIAEAIERDTRWVHVRQKLLTLPDEVQQQAAAGLLSSESINRIWTLETPQRQIIAANEMAKHKGHGRGRNSSELALEYRPSFRPRKTKAQLQTKVAEMLDRGVEGLGPRVAVWATGGITDAELEVDIKRQLVTQKKLEGVVDRCPPKKRPPKK